MRKKMTNGKNSRKPTYPDTSNKEGILASQPFVVEDGFVIAESSEMGVNVPKGMAQQETAMSGINVLERILRDIKTEGNNIGFRAVRHEFGRDVCGDDAIWVHIKIEEDLGASREKIKQMRRIAENFEKRLVDEGISSWSYVGYEAA